MSVDTQPRHPAGAPTGGQFATAAKSEPDVALEGPLTGGARDDLAMDRIALLLGSVDSWDGIGDYTEFAANELLATGRPDVGETDPDVYRAKMTAYRAARTGAVTKTTEQLDRMALTLGTADNWDADHLEWIADQVAASGRPHPGGSVAPDEFIVRIAQARAERATGPAEAQEEVVDGLAGYFERQAQQDWLSGSYDGLTVHPTQGDDGAWSYSRTVTVRVKDWAGTQADEDVDLSGTAAEKLIDDLARWSPTPGELTPVTR